MESSNNNQESIMVLEEHGFGRSNDENHLLNNPPNASFSSSSSSSSFSVLVHNNCHPMMVKLSLQGREVIVSSDDKPSLGLSLTKTPDFLNLLGTQLSQASSQRSASASSSSSETHHNNPIILQRFHAQTTTLALAPTNQFQYPHHHPTSDKLKASNFPAMFIKIGSWQRVAMNEGELVAKIYYAKRKIVWEVLDGALKSKIEIQWPDIEGIRATIPDDDDDVHAAGVLEVELNQPPHFFRETNPQPRKRSLWTPSTDFTGGQAPMCRRHLIKFPGGLLNKPYEKLLQCDPRLLELSRQPFPRINSPYFHLEYDNTFNFTSSSPAAAAGGADTSRLQQQYRPLPASSPLLVSPRPLMLQNLNPVRAFWDSNDPTGQRAAAPYGNVSNHYWVQGTTNINMVEDGSFYLRDQDHIIEGLPHFSSSAAATLLQEQAANYGAAASNTLVSLQGDIERLLQGDSQSLSLSLDEGVLTETFINAPYNNGLNDDLQQLQQQQEYKPEELINGEIFRAESGLLCPQPLQGLPPRTSNDENGMMPPPDGIDYYYASSSDTDADYGIQP